MDSVLKTLNDAAFELESALDTPATNDMIYAWNNGLGVKLRPGELSVVVGVLHASNAPPHLTFLNGKNEVARHMLRSRAIRMALDNIANAIGTLTDRK